MTKTISVVVQGTEAEVFQIEVFLQMCQDFNRLGVPFLSAASETLSKINEDFKWTDKK